MEKAYRYVLRVMNCFQLYRNLSLVHKKANEKAEKIHILFCQNCVPLELISDNGGEFTSVLSTLINRKYGYKHITITPYNSHTNGKCKRVNQTIKISLFKL